MTDVDSPRPGIHRLGAVVVLCAVALIGFLALNRVDRGGERDATAAHPTGARQTSVPNAGGSAASGAGAGTEGGALPSGGGSVPAGPAASVPALGPAAPATASSVPAVGADTAPAGAGATGGGAALTGGGSGGRFTLLGVGAPLPSGAECARRVRAVPENVPENESYNRTRGRGVSGTILSDAGSVAPNDFERRVDGDFVGSTDEIIQWAACKWGFDEDTVRAQAYAESSWYAGKLGDCDRVTTQPSTDGCASVGLIQVQAAALSAPAHRNVFPAVQTSTAMNLDYALAVMRLCFEGKELWLGEVSGGYGPGDVTGCLGRWFSGAFRDQRGLDYAAEVERVRRERPWEERFVGCPSWATSRHCSR